MGVTLAAAGQETQQNQGFHDLPPSCQMGVVPGRPHRPPLRNVKAAKPVAKAPGHRETCRHYRELGTETPCVTPVRGALVRNADGTALTHADTGP